MDVFHKLRELFASSRFDLASRRTHDMGDDRKKTRCEAQDCGLTGGV